MEAVTGTLKTEDGTSECRWQEHYPNGRKKKKTKKKSRLIRALKLTCECASADNDNELLHYGCQYVGDPHDYDPYNNGGQPAFYKDMAQEAASMVMT